MKLYEQTNEEILLEYGTSHEGLSGEQAAERLKTYGRNKLAEHKKKGMLQRIWEQIKDPMVLVLIGAAILSAAFSEVADMIIILVVVALNTVLGIIQESKAENAIEALQKLAAPQSRVRRGNAVVVIPSEEIVPGDIVLLEAGDAIPADMRIIDAFSLKIEEAALTGESVPVTKQNEPIQEGDQEVPLGDRKNMAYMGTNVSYGRGEAVVTGTGMNTEMGRIADILSGTQEERTPLQQKLSVLSKILSIAVLLICAVVFAVSVLRGGGGTAYIFESLLIAISLAVAAIPEGLVVVVTILLSIGVTRMSARHAIIRRLTAVETLGCTQVICSDKTGTLTQNRMTVLACHGNEQLLASAMFHCNDVQKDAEGSYVGDPTEIALEEYAVKCGLRDKTPRVGEAPFDSERKLMSTLHAKENKCIQYTKGAPDVLLSRCGSIYSDGKVAPMTPERMQAVLIENKNMADKALRVLGAAYKEYETAPANASAETLEQDLIFIGLVGMMDPIRIEAKAAIEECKQAGIRAVMITGDHRDTAVAIAKELDILTEEAQAITGTELNALSDEEFEESISNIAVYARVQPEHKVRIVTAWKKKGKITAMTGDGVNDAPALKCADIGVGMGITGTDVTKNVSDMVLSDDNFASIVYAVEEGRRIYENIRKVIQFLLSSNLSEVISIFIATMVGLKLFEPIHILWINLVTDTFPAIALGMERAESDSMLKQPRDAKESIFADGLGTQVIFQGTVIAFLTLGAFFIGNAISHNIGMTMAFLTLSLCEVFHSYNMRSRRESIFAIRGQNKYLLGAMALSFLLTVSVIYIPGLNTLFDLAVLSLENLLTAISLALAIVPIVELEKALKRKRTKKNA